MDQFSFLKEKKAVGGLSAGAVISLVLHGLTLAWILIHYPEPRQVEQPRVRYVELMQNNLARTFTEAPGEKQVTARKDALWSDANRRAQSPRATGEQPVQRPGSGGSYVPGGGAAAGAASSQQPSANESASQNAAQSSGESDRVPALVPENAAKDGGNARSVDWGSAIRQAGQYASLGTPGGGQGFPGGEPGFAESGPISFETQWYPWGEYAATMVRKIRLHWYENMPPLIRMGVKGVVTIRFTIQRSGQITNIEVLKESGKPPYDFAARKAIELSSALPPLPADFPNPSERVTAQFFYNIDPSTGRE